MKSTNVLSIFALLSLAACVNLPPQYKDSPSKIELNPEASGVSVVEFIPSQDREKYDEVAMINCALGGNMRSAETNVDSCNNKFKNEAHKLGAKIVYVKPESKKFAQVNINTGESMIACENCVEMSGVVLKEKTATKK